MKSNTVHQHNSQQGVSFIDGIRTIVGAAHVLTDPTTMRSYLTDWTGRWEGAATAVVRPGTTEEVAAVVRRCSRALVPITPQGGNTGLVGGGIPTDGSIVLSTRRLDRIEEVDPIGYTISAGAGVTVAAADAAARRSGLRLGIDLGSKESATLGGIVATNAGGARMIRHGNTRSRLLGIEAVLGDGSILRRWAPLTKDNIGYDLPAVLAGSEGTLGVVTKVLMKLAPAVTDARVVLAGVETIDAALMLVDRARRAGATIEAAEFMTAAGVEVVCRHTAVRHPFATRPPMYLLLEVSGHPEIEQAALDLLSGSADLVEVATVEPAPARRLWHLREAHTEAIGRESATPVIKLDISVPLAVMSSFVAALGTTLASRYPDTRSILFGHCADGNIHINLVNTPTTDADGVTDAVFRLVAEYGGSISAEHGIGQAKRRWVHLGRTTRDIEVMQLIKSAFDPNRILNPGVLLPE